MTDIFCVAGASRWGVNYGGVIIASPKVNEAIYVGRLVWEIQLRCASNKYLRNASLGRLDKYTRDRRLCRSRVANTINQKHPCWPVLHGFHITGRSWWHHYASHGAVDWISDTKRQPVAHLRKIKKTRPVPYIITDAIYSFLNIPKVVWSDRKWSRNCSKGDIPYKFTRV